MIYRIFRHKYAVHLAFIVVIDICISCNNFKSRAVKIEKEWHHKTIRIPDNLTWKIDGRDTTCSIESPYKILVYVDSAGCMPCLFNPARWKSLTDTCKNEYMNVSFLFVIQAKDYSELEIAFIREDFVYPVIHDKFSEFDKLNHFPPAPYNTFLLDKDNKVLLTGSPIHLPKMWELYKKTITQQK